eukprot:14785857-Alexandrium_andersonii.AAC.1
MASPAPGWCAAPVRVLLPLAARQVGGARSGLLPWLPLRWLLLGKATSLWASGPGAPLDAAAVAFAAGRTPPSRPPLLGPACSAGAARLRPLLPLPP